MMLLRPDKTIASINGRIAANKAAVRIAAELTDEDAALSSEDIDVVTLAFDAPMSGSAAMMCVPVAGRGVFTRAEEISLNGVRGTPGPAPNERLGVVDTMIYADVRRSGDAGYTGATLLRDIIAGQEIDIDCVAVEGSRHTAKARLGDLEFARFYVYNVFVEASLPQSATDALERGSRVLLNGANGIILGGGTRNSAQQRAWSIAANMRDMDAALMQAPATGADRSLRHMIAMAVPVLDRAILDDLRAWSRTRVSSERATAAARQLRERILQRAFTLTATDYAI